MRYDALTDKEKRAYDRHLESVMYQRSVIETGIDEGLEEGLKQGREEGDRIAQTMKKSGLPPQQIADMTSLPLEEILSL